MGKSTITGIDIGHHSIKAVVLKPAKGTYVLSDYLELPVETGIFTDNHALNYQKIVKKLKELRKALPLFSRQVALSIPDNAVISKVLQIDSDLDDHEKEYAITQAFSLQSSFPTQELCLDYSEIDDVDTRAGMQSIQVYATRKEVVESRMATFHKAGFEPIVLDVHGHSLIKVWQRAALAQQKQDWFLLDIGFLHSTVCIDLLNKPPYSKDIPIGTQMMANPILERQSIAESLAVTEPMELAEPKPLYAQNYLNRNEESIVSLLVEKLQRHIQMLGTTHDLSVQGIWLTGEGALTPNLLLEITKQLAIECEPLDPFELLDNFNVSRQVSPLNSHAYTAAVGLALRAIDWRS